MVESQWQVRYRYLMCSLYSRQEWLKDSGGCAIDILYIRRKGGGWKTLLRTLCVCVCVCYIIYMYYYIYVLHVNTCT